MAHDETDEDPSVPVIDAVDPLDRILEMSMGGLPAIAPDGGFSPTIVGSPEPIPEATPETMVCMRDCRYYFEASIPFAAGNTKGSFGRPAIQSTRYCTYTQNPIDLTDENVFECSGWDPTDPVVKADRLARRKTWLDENPDVHPVKFDGPLVKEGN